jgi:hypothetical protein
MALAVIVPMSAIGTKRTFNCRLPMSAFGGKADMKRTYSLIILDVYVELLFQLAKPNGKETA